VCLKGHDAVGLAGDPGSPIHRLDPRAKVIGLLGLTVVAVAVPLRAAWPAWVACAAALVAVAAVARVGPGTVWRRARVVLPLVLLVAAALPFVRGGAQVDVGPLAVSRDGLEVLAAVSAKATIGTVSAVLLAATTTFPAVLRALATLRVPAVLVLIAGVTYRYLFVVAGQAQRTRTAMAARGFRPRHLLHAAPIGRAATALFLRSHARGERVHLAMVARGYSGAVPVLHQPAAARRDAAFAALVVGAPLAVLLGSML